MADRTGYLGIVTMVFAPFLWFAFRFFSEDASNPNQIYASGLALLYLLGALTAAVALRRLRVTGRGKGAIILFAVQVVGLALAMAFDVLSYAAPQMKDSTLFFITDMAYPFSHLLMNIVGIAIWRGEVWSGWRLVPAFLVGLALPAFFACGALVGFEKSMPVFPAMVTAGWFLLGLSVLTWRPGLR